MIGLQRDTRSGIRAVLPAPLAMATDAFGSESETRLIKHSDVDLTNEADVRRHYLQIRIAARAVCGSSQLAPVMSQSLKHCAEDATARAIARVNAPGLTRYHATLIAAANRAARSF